MPVTELPILCVVLIQRHRFEWSGVWSLGVNATTEHSIGRFYALTAAAAMSRARHIACASHAAIATGDDIDAPPTVSVDDLSVGERLAEETSPYPVRSNATR